MDLAGYLPSLSISLHLCKIIKHLSYHPGLYVYEVIMLCKHPSALSIVLIMTVTLYQDRFCCYGYLSHKT